ncbi:hypothetical protein KSP40_PGU001311 [Platanthera guangdongensis]|uniref:Ribosomal protein L33 n=1 Tax=Platanthera guangdongensis TaxID=2320717 RepID=A0ABR2M1U0_9ASPA
MVVAAWAEQQQCELNICVRRLSRSKVCLLTKKEVGKTIMRINGHFMHMLTMVIL